LPPVEEEIHEDEFDAGGSIYLLGTPGDSMAYLGIKFNWALFAHNDRIISCANIGNYGIVTSATDRLVKMWSFAGLPLGTLLQSVPVGVRSRSWDLDIDVDAAIRQEQEELDNIIEKAQKVARDPHKPNIATVDFTGMKLGTDSAEFSRSVLRQRIEKSAWILGLDFPRNKGDDGNSRFDDASTIGEQSIASSTNKSVNDALKEIKSTESAVDYGLKTKCMSTTQQKRQAAKLLAVSKSYEAKTGVEIKQATPKETSAREEEVDEKSHAHLSKLLTAAEGLQDEASINKDLYSLDSISQLSVGDAHAITKPVPAVRAKLLQSIKQAHEKGPRTIYMAQASRKYDSFRALDRALQAIGDDTALSPSAAELEELRRIREQKHHQLFRRGTQGTATLYNRSCLSFGGSLASQTTEEDSLALPPISDQRASATLSIRSAAP
jgi:hypothetical protein